LFLRANVCNLNFAEDPISSQVASRVAISLEGKASPGQPLTRGKKAMSDLLSAWEAKLIELVGDLHSCERRRKEVKDLAGHAADAARESERSEDIRKQMTNLMDLFPDVELEYSILDGVPVWRYEEFSIARMKSLFRPTYSVSANGRLIKKRHSLRKAKNELKLLLRKRIMAQVEGVMR
jgi:hypothetical protein